MLPDEEQIAVFEVAERAELEHYQNSHNLTVGKGCLTVAARLTIGRHQRLFSFCLSNSLQNSSTAQKISVILQLAIMSLFFFLTLQVVGIQT